MGLSWLLGRFCFVQPLMPIGAFNKIWLTAYLCIKLSYLSFFLCMPARVAAVLMMASKKPLLVVNVFLDFPAYCIPHG